MIESTCTSNSGLDVDGEKADDSSGDGYMLSSMFGGSMAAVDSHDAGDDHVSQPLEEPSIEDSHSDEEIQYGLSHFGESGDGEEACLHSGYSAWEVRTAGTMPMVPNIFAVVCATNEEGERVYPWGTVSIHDEGHSDFRRLQRLVLESDKVTEMVELAQQVSIRLATPSSSVGCSSLPAVSRVASLSGALWAPIAKWWSKVWLCAHPAPDNGGSSPRAAGAFCGGTSVSADDKKRRAVRCALDLVVLAGLAMVIASAVCHLQKLLTRG